MTFEGPHNRGYFSSNRRDGRGYDHIYSFENPEVVTTIKGWVYEMGGYELPAAQVMVVGNDGTYKKLSVRGDGSFTMVINPKVDYLLMASCKGFLNHKEELRVDTVKESKEYVLQFPLAPSQPSCSSTTSSMISTRLRSPQPQPRRWTNW